MPLCQVVLLAAGVELSADQMAELRALINSGEVAASVATRARIVQWQVEKRPNKEIAELAGVSRSTVDLWLGLGGLPPGPTGPSGSRFPRGCGPGFSR